MPRQVGPYKIVSELGRGGMAVVYLARQPALGRDVALKELAALHAADDSLAQRFIREARVAGSLSHPSVVTVFDFVHEDGKPYIAMEYLERGSLRPFVGALTLPQVVGVLDSLLAALAHAETKRIVHRDIKPENLLVTSDGGVKIADFGIAKAYQQVVTEEMLTPAGATVGTPAYMAPEQAMASEVGPWTDLYQTGVVAFELLAGRVPFRVEGNPLAVMMQHISDPVPALPAGTDPALEAWVRALLEKDPSARPATAREASEALEEIVVAAVGPLWRRSARLGEAPAAARSAPSEFVSWQADVPRSTVRPAPPPPPPPPPVTPPPGATPPPTPAGTPAAPPSSSDAYRTFAPGAAPRTPSADTPAPPPDADTPPPADTPAPSPPAAVPRPNADPPPPTDTPAPSPPAATVPPQADAPPPAAATTPLPAADPPAPAPTAAPTRPLAAAAAPPDAPRRDYTSRRWRAPLLAGVAAIVAVVLIVILLPSGDDPDDRATLDPTPTATASPTATAAAGPFPVGEGPDGVAVGAGAVWAVSSGDGTLTRIDPTTGERETVEVGEAPDSVIVARDSVWVTATDDNQVVRFTTDEQPEMIDVYDVGEAPEGIAATDNAIWTANSGDGSVSQIIVDSGDINTVPDVGEQPLGIAIGAGGVWVADPTGGVVVRVHGGRHEVVKTIDGLGPDPRAVAIVGRSVWVATSQDGRVWRIDADENDGEVAGFVEVGGSPRGLATDGERLWVTDRTGDRVVTVDPDAMRIVKRDRAAGGPLNVAPDEDSLWVTLFDAGDVLRLER